MREQAARVPFIKTVLYPYPINRFYRAGQIFPPSSPLFFRFPFLRLIREIERSLDAQVLARLLDHGRRNIGLHLSINLSNSNLVNILIYPVNVFLDISQILNSVK